MLTVLLIFTYFFALLLIGRLSRGRANNNSFFRGERKSRWWLVAFGMIGASVSGVTFVSVPGMVIQNDMTYLQMCMGFIVGYFIVAFVLLPIYYRLNLTTIYTYLDNRFGNCSRQTGSWFFLVAKMISTAVKFYVACFIVYELMEYWFPFHFSADLGFLVVVLLMVFLVWLYSHQGGIKSLVWTDTLQTILMLTSLVLIIMSVVEKLDVTLGDVASMIIDNTHSRIFVFNDWISTQNFWKQFVSGAFIVVVMTGLDQDMMQKNLTCSSLRNAQKDMSSYGFAFLPVNFLFLILGVLLLILVQKEGLALPSKGDELLTMFAVTGKLGELPMALFLIGILSASFSTADSALTALTTSFCVDVCRANNNERLRRRTHFAMALMLALLIFLFKSIGSSSIINTIYTLVGYTYGPLLGMFAFGLFTKRQVKDSIVPFVAIASPIICYIINSISSTYLDYYFGYELLLLNGLLVFIGMLIISSKGNYIE